MPKYEAVISYEKKDEHSFLVALVPALSIPQEYENEDEINITECAVIAANHGNNGRNKWAYVHLEADEKEAIGNALAAQCAKMSKWYWCTLYKQGDTEREALLHRAEQAEARCKRLEELCIHIYNSGYHAGHHDTVEGRYVDIHSSDMDTYHAEEVAELLAALVGEGEGEWTKE